jgi:phosphatidate cytidylyltransferase
MINADQWSDLKPRVLSALAMLVIGMTDLWVGGLAFHLMLGLLIGAMLWELSRMTGRGQWAVMLGVVGGLALVAGLTLFMRGHGLWSLVPIILPVALGAVLGGSHARRTQFGYSCLIMTAGISLGLMREQALAEVLWLVAVVVASDTLGYFAGRTLGGPKFWPRISPKKTWSGTIAGWIGAALVGLAFWWQGLGGVHLIWISPLLALAGQIGDIAESAIKRRAGVKDSSRLIPGHGGVMDRFDALIAAAVAVVPFLPILGFGG